MVEFDVVRRLLSELAVFVFLVRRSKCRSEIHKALCALKSPHIIVLCLLGAGLTQ